MQLIEKKESASLNNRQFVFAFTLLFLLVLLRTAWISDDAAITLRTVLNFIHGFGPTFNIDERVQAYTHPLWFFILSLGSIISGNVFYTTFVISITVTIISLGLLLNNISRNPFVLVLIGLAVVLSKAFVDFSTSGLENPLSHLLLLLAVLVASSHIETGNDKLSIFFLICSGLYLNRPDLLVVAFPLAVYLALPDIRHPKRLVAKLSIAAVPVIIWTAFSFFYYGFPFPNTAYAKLGSGITTDERVVQGLKYLFHSVDKDPVTIFVIVAGVTIGLCGSRLSKSLSAGVILYLLYVLYIGGDFMEGRYLTVPFFMSLIIFAREIPTKSLAIALMISVVILGSTSIYPNLIAGSSYSNNTIQNNGIADERGFYYQNHGLLTAKRNTFTPPQ
jgi:arabinofuranosyltransferase